MKPQGAVRVGKALGAEVDAVVRWLRLAQPLRSQWWAIRHDTRFILRLRKPLCSRLWMPCPFIRMMEIEQPLRLGLRMSGCCNGEAWADVVFPMPHVMLL